MGDNKDTNVIFRKSLKMKSHFIIYIGKCIDSIVCVYIYIYTYIYIYIYAENSHHLIKLNSLAVKGKFFRENTCATEVSVAHVIAPLVKTSLWQQKLYEMY